MQACLIGGIPVGDHGDGLIFTGCGDGFQHRGDGIFSAAAIREMIGGDFMGLRRDKEPDVVPDFFDFDIGFISGEEGIDGAFVIEVKLMAVVGGGLDVIEDGLIREMDAPDITKHVGGFSGGDGIGDVEG